MLIYGSCAIKHHFPDYKRIPNDVDLISADKVIGCDCHYTPAFSYIFEHNSDDVYVDPDLLYTIKISHAAWDINWDKTLKDIVFLKSKECVIDIDLYNLLILDWQQIHGTKSHIKLNVQNSSFFTTNVDRIYDHDYLHEMVKFYNQPLNHKIRKDLNSPLCSEQLFNSMSFDDRIKCAMEEVFVFMLERFLIPKKVVGINRAKYLALKTLITSSTWGWFNRFLIINFETLIKYDNTHFIECVINTRKFVE